MAGLRYMVHTSAEKTMTIVETPIAPAAPRSPWHSPVPYLFGGLAAMLGLIAFALLILACSYWRLSGYLEGGNNNNNNNNDGDLEAGESINGDESEKQNKKLAPPQFLVIMPGQEKPTCLATPMTSSRASSFGSNSCSSSSSTDYGTEKSISSGGGESEDQKKQDENGSTTTVTHTHTHTHTHTQQLEMTNLAMETVGHDTVAHDDDGGQVQ